MRRHLPFVALIAIAAPALALGEDLSIRGAFKIGHFVTISRPNDDVWLHVCSPEEKRMKLEIHAFQSAVDRIVHDAIKRRTEAAPRAARDRVRRQFRVIEFAPSEWRDIQTPFYEIVAVEDGFISLWEEGSIRHIALNRVSEVLGSGVPEGEQKTTAERELTAVRGHALARMLLLYHLDVGAFPRDKEGFSALLEAPMELREGSLWKGPYFPGREIPKDSWDQSYRWKFDAGSDEIVVASNGPDTVADTDDDVVHRAKVSTDADPPRADEPVDPFGDPDPGEDPFG